MKPFNLFITISLFLIFGGFIFFKNGFTKVESKQQPITEVLFNIPSYTNYSSAALAASEKNGKTVLFFAATRWCQSCSQLDQEIVKRMSEIPTNITILKVDYDNDIAMNQKYNVTSQHTLIVLEQNGKELGRWLGGNFDNLLQELRKT